MKWPALCCAFLLAACASSGPRWQINAARWLETYREQALSGEARLAKAAYASALAEYRRGGDWDGLALTHLTRCAIERVTDQALQGCAAYRAQQPLGVSRSNDAYARWLLGEAKPEDIEFLPPAYRDLAASWSNGKQDTLAATLGHIEQPLSVLVALAVVWRQLPDPRPALDACAALAGQQGWLSAHRTCLARAISVFRESGDTLAAAEREQRLRLLTP